MSGGEAAAEAAPNQEENPMNFLRVDFWRKVGGKKTEAEHEEHFHGCVSIHMGLIGVRVNATIGPDSLEDTTLEMLSFARRIAESLAKETGVKGNLVYNWDGSKFSEMNLKSESGLTLGLPSS